MDVELFMRTYIESADQGLKQIAVACGFGSTDSMRRAFWRSVGTTPHKYRRQLYSPPNRVSAAADGCRSKFLNPLEGAAQPSPGSCLPVLCGTLYRTAHWIL